MPDILKGGCLCGRVRYTIPEPTVVAICHCTNCRRQSGSAFSFNFGVPLNELRIEGILKTFRDRGDNGKGVERQFCPECGSPIMSLLESVPSFAIVKAGTLDDPSTHAPQFQVWGRSALGWCTASLDIPYHDMQPREF